MRIHREGRLIIPLAFLFLAALWVAIWLPLHNNALGWIGIPLAVAGLVFFYFIVNFFRNPPVESPQNPMQILAPCEGKVVVIEEVEDKIGLHGKAIQLSIFMSPLNVHVNRNPIGGKVKLLKYFPGKYLVAWHPKSSTENEQTYILLENERMRIAFKQIAGAVARRIRWYIKEGDRVDQGAEMGFIRFGSRVDVLLPPECQVLVKLDEKVKAGETVLAEMPA